MSFTHPDDLHAAFAAAFQAGDVTTLVDLHEDSAIQIQQDGATVTGRDALAGVFTRLLASGLTMQGDPQKAIVAGDLALTSTHYRLANDEPDGARTVATSRAAPFSADLSTNMSEARRRPGQDSRDRVLAPHRACAPPSSTALLKWRCVPRAARSALLRA